MQYIDNLATNKLINDYSNFLTVVYIAYNGKNGDTHQGSMLWNFETQKPP